jgi:hypothetical protein
LRTQTSRKVDEQIPDIDVDRDRELENIMGNLMIAQYQVDKLRSRLAERVAYGSAASKKVSSHIFKHNDRWYKITVRVDETAVNHNISEEVK